MITTIIITMKMKIIIKEINEKITEQSDWREVDIVGQRKKMKNWKC